MSEIGSSPQVGVWKKCLKPPPSYIFAPNKKLKKNTHLNLWLPLGKPTWFTSQGLGGGWNGYCSGGFAWGCCEILKNTLLGTNISYIIYPIPKLHFWRRWFSISCRCCMLVPWKICVSNTKIYTTIWVSSLARNSHHREYYIFSRGFL